MSKPIKLELSQSQALVLFDWLSGPQKESHTSDAAAQRVLWILEGQLEKTLVEPLKPDYQELLEAARRTVNKGG